MPIFGSGGGMGGPVLSTVYHKEHFFLILLLKNQCFGKILGSAEIRTQGRLGEKLERFLVELKPRTCEHK